MRGERTLTLGALAVGIAMGSAYAGGIRWNMSPSMPMGVWRVQTIRGAVTRGEVVTLCLDPAAAALGRRRDYLTGGECPGDVELLIKTVVAIPGDLVEVSSAGMSVNGVLIPHSQPLGADDLNRPMRAVPNGIYRVAHDQVWVVGDTEPRSYDSRYYGAVPIENIRGRAVPFFIDFGR
jgi:conjugative transfer signal peptidase TraF